MTQYLNNLLEDAGHRLKSAGVKTTTYELRLMLGAAMGVDPGQVMFANAGLTQEQGGAFAAMLQQRERHMPVDKILGSRGFYKYDFKVTTDVLSPRPDTEILVEAALGFIAAEGYKTVLELGVGSGCIITTLLAENSKLEGLGVDISDSALQIAAENAAALHVSARLVLKQGSWFEDGFLALIGQRFDLVVSNPPYISSSEIATLDPEVKDYDPMLALDGGADGLDSYRQIAELAPYLLNDGGRILLEVGENQAAEVMQIFAFHGLQPEKSIYDLAGIERCVVLKKK